jgi:Protein of unknown function (DUF2795)
MTETMIWAFPGNVTDRQLDGFEVRAPDGTIGTVERATYDVGASYIVVDTGPWISGKRAMLPAGVIQRVDRDAGIVHVGRTREEIRSAPEFETGLTDANRERLGAHYGGGAPAETPARRQPTRQRAGTGSRRASTTSQKRSTRQRGGARSSSEGPTKEELYDEAKRLGVEGRSRMNKRGLAQAVSRAKQRQGRGGSKASKATPVEVQRFLDGVRYPTNKGDLLREAQKSRASAKVRSTLQRLPDKRFKAPTEVSKAIGQLSGRR